MPEPEKLPRGIVVDMGTAISVVLALIGIFVTIAYALYLDQKNKREKDLVFNVIPPLTVASIFRKDTGYSITITYSTPDTGPQEVSAVTVLFLRFMNRGRVAIRRSDLIPTDPLRIVLVGDKVLDISLASVVRSVNSISLGPLTRDNADASATIEFEFLDHLDGAVIQVVTAGSNIKAALRGTVVEMPQGIKRTPNTKRPIIMRFLWIVPGAIVISLGGVAFVNYRITGNWQGGLLLLIGLLVEIAAVFLVGLIPVSVLSKRRGKSDADVLRLLKPPEWYGRQFLVYGDTDQWYLD
jgi:hypothetical protein